MEDGLPTDAVGLRRLKAMGFSDKRLAVLAVRGIHVAGGLGETNARRSGLLHDALKMMEPPSAEALWLGVRIERKLGNRAAEGGFASQLRSRYPSSMEYQEFLKGNFE